MIPLFSFQPFLYEDIDTQWNTKPCNNIRLKFYLESVAEFQCSLQSIGLDLLLSRHKFSRLIALLVDPSKRNLIIINDDFINDFYNVQSDIVSALS